MTRFFAGAILGLVAGLLLAPEKGEDLRNEIADTAENIKKKIMRIAGKTSAELDDLRDILGSEIEGMGEDVRHRILTILDESSEGARTIQRTLTTELR
ncbi:MAG: YtxH domain-containing protein [Taibaiella sp.]|nr:YtxH domain-containing protein [Taibaiella sp.]